MVAGAVLALFGMGPAAKLLGSIFIGAGNALLLASRMRIFASLDARRGTIGLLAGSGLAAIIRFAFDLLRFEGATVAIAFVCIPVAWVLLLWQNRFVDQALPMFEDEPLANASSYRHALRTNWRSAMYVGCIGLVCGVVRAFSFDGIARDIVNYASMLGGLIAALVILAIWRRHTIRSSITRLFRLLFPFIVITLCAMPFVPELPMGLLACLIYITFSFGSLCISIQSIQVARDSGVNPLFIYSLLTAIVCSMQLLGYLFSLAIITYTSQFSTTLYVISLVSVAALALAMYATRGVFVEDATENQNIELVALSRKEPGDSERASKSGADEPHLRDSIALKSATIAKRHYLTTRECEILDLIAHGNSQPSIAKKLYISENTVKTHVRRIYVKLDVHKREELLALYEQ